MNKIIGVIVALLFFSCNSKEVDLDLSKLNIETTFSLDTINTKDWDNLYVVKPYEQVDTVRYEIPESVLKEVKTTTMFDTYCTLLFFKTDQLVNYSFIRRNVADFLMLENKSYPANHVFELTNERKVVDWEKQQ